jgi:membrane protease YdiL (CAAX protease family)
MNKRKLLIFGILAIVCMILIGKLVSGLTGRIVPEANTLHTYLLNKGIFAVLLLIAMRQLGGLKFYGIERGRNWWFMVPALPILLLTVAVFFAPNAAFGLGLSSTVGWILVAIFVGIGEECTFRGILWRAFEHRGVLVTAFITSALFGTAHIMGLFAGIPWQIVTSQMVFAFGVGMMFSAVRLVAGSLVVPIVLHAVFDAGAIVAAGGLSEMFDETLTVGRLLIPGVVFAAWGLVCILVVSKRRSRKDLQDRQNIELAAANEVAGASSKS